MWGDKEGLWGGRGAAKALGSLPAHLAGPCQTPAAHLSLQRERICRLMRTVPTFAWASADVAGMGEGVTQDKAQTGWSPASSSFPAPPPLAGICWEQGERLMGAKQTSKLKPLWTCG